VGAITKIELVGTIGIPCRELKVLFEEKWPIFQDKNSICSQEIFSEAETCLEDGGLHFDALPFHKAS
jgi:hypothetical protein